MDDKIVSMREIQRNYRELIDRVKKTKQPMYLGARLQKEAVLVDIDSFTQLSRRVGGQQWEQVKKTLERISKKGNGINSTKLLRDDRRRH